MEKKQGFRGGCEFGLMQTLMQFELESYWRVGIEKTNFTIQGL